MIFLGRNYMAEKTKICCFDVDEDIKEYLSREHEVFSGSFGTRISMPEKRISSSIIRPNYQFPLNMHEYDLFVLDMKERPTKKYYQEDYVSHKKETISDRHLLSRTSIDIFNPIPYGALHFYRKIREKRDKCPIIIVFQSEEVYRTYYWSDGEKETRSNYDFCIMPTMNNIRGSQVALMENEASEILFKNYMDEVEYFCAYDCSKKGYIPLLKNRNGECVSYIHLMEDALVIMLPQMKHKAAFVKHLFENYLYERFSEYFPYVEEKSWIHHAEYMLPNENALREELEKMKKEYEDKKAAIENQIEENKSKYSFLHAMLTATGAELVRAVIEYLKWLGFENVIDNDAITAGDNEEDIKVDLGDKGLLIMEVKGIHGTSKDSECSQIDKIRHRRERERKAFDVHALYVVNHQRGVEPIKRTNPPFLPKQISDAEDDERGLVTTWQLYNLYFDIERGVIDKDDAREAMMQFGLVSFVPRGAVKIGVPYRYCENNVICVELNGQNVSVGDEIYAYDGQNWYKTEILSIQEDHQDLVSAATGRIGVGLSDMLPKNQEVYVKCRETKENAAK